MATSEIEILDVTQIEPKFKHSTIFQHFNALQQGEAFVIHNDHDPKPLYYQLLAEKGDIFYWEYLMEGPQWWKVKIGKKKLNAVEETIGAIAAKDLRKAAVFSKYDLDFCCDGKKSIAEACEGAGVPVEKVREELDHLPEQSVSADRDFSNWDLGFLSDYIVNVHHKYVTDSIPVLTDLSQKVTSRHEAAHPELNEIKKHVAGLLSEMKFHQIKEEKILFPFVRQMAQCEREQKPFTNPPFGTIGSPVQMMLADHADAAAHIHAIRALSQRYLVPDDGCESYRLYYHKLKEFDEDLHQHLHLENNILFPKAIELEKKLTH